MSRAEQFFSEELSQIEDVGIRRFTEHVLNKAPAYFWIVPSSSTGKYHPPQSKGEGGLVRHTKATVYFAADRLCRSFSIEGFEKDIVIAACLLHDSIKYGQPMLKYTTKTHPKDAADFVHNVFKQGGPETAISMEALTGICKAIAHHMGQWGGTKKFPEEYTTTELIVHLADMCSAGREVNLEFLQENLIG